MYDTLDKKERAIAISVVKKGADRDKTKENLEELSFLAETAGAEVVEMIYQELVKPSKSTSIGKGKVAELKEMIVEQNIDLIIFDDDLTPAQVRNLENELQIKVLDRSGIILDIFVERAKTNEAKTQVELAQLQYLMPRLTRMWTHLSKQYGGIGTKGPGETQIETDRRIIRNRIQLLKEKLDLISTQKEQQRKGRKSMPRFALVGYTNAGKSTLMKNITNENVYVEDKLFATLDTTVRIFDLPSGQEALLSDTVGFIKKLPTHLVASFRSTLAEASEADIILHVVDVSNPFFREHIDIVEKTLQSLNITDIPTILVCNKIDKLEDLDGLKLIEEEYKDCLFVAASKGLNVQTLLERMQEKYNENCKTTSLIIPYTESQRVSWLYKYCEIIERDDTDNGTEITLRVPLDQEEYFANHYKPFIQ